MSIPLLINLKIYNKIKKQLQTQEEIVCLTQDMHVIVVSIALDLLKSGKKVKAKIKRGY